MSINANFEEAVFTNSDRLQVDDAISILFSVAETASADLIEILDRIIGKNVYDIPLERLVHAYLAFGTSGKARAKIMGLLQKRIRDELYNFNS